MGLILNFLMTFFIIRVQENPREFARMTREMLIADYNEEHFPQICHESPPRYQRRTTPRHAGAHAASERRIARRSWTSAAGRDGRSASGGTRNDIASLNIIRGTRFY